MQLAIFYFLRVNLLRNRFSLRSKDNTRNNHLEFHYRESMLCPNGNSFMTN